MLEYYNYIKSLHLIFVITWFAGLFYIPRLFIYHIEASLKKSPDREILIAQFQLMAKRLWFIITWPSAILATIFAIWLFIPYSKLVTTTLDACKTLLRRAIVFVPSQMSSNL